MPVIVTNPSGDYHCKSCRDEHSVVRVYRNEMPTRTNWLTLCVGCARDLITKLQEFEAPCSVCTEQRQIQDLEECDQCGERHVCGSCRINGVCCDMPKDDE